MLKLETLRRKQPRALWTVAFLAVLCASKDGHAASFDCGLAKTPPEIAICSNAALSDLDYQLGAAYRKAIESHPEIRRSQIIWIKERNQRCQSDVICLGDAVEKRLQELQRIGGTEGESIGLDSEGAEQPGSVEMPRKDRDKVQQTGRSQPTSIVDEVRPQESKASTDTGRPHEEPTTAPVGRSNSTLNSPIAVIGLVVSGAFAGIIGSVLFGAFRRRRRVKYDVDSRLSARSAETNQRTVDIPPRAPPVLISAVGEEPVSEARPNLDAWVQAFDKNGGERPSGRELSSVARPKLALVKFGRFAIVLAGLIVAGALIVRKVQVAKRVTEERTSTGSSTPTPKSDLSINDVPVKVSTVMRSEHLGYVETGGVKTRAVNYMATYLRVTALADSIRITELVLNRGNCEISQEMPMVLRFGETKEIYVSCDEVVEVAFRTNLGNFTLSE